MKELFLLIRERLLLNEPLVMVTVTESSGSVPRGAGAMMLVGKEGDSAAKRLWGSIGGGLPEHLAIEEAGKILQSRDTGANAAEATLKKYTLHSGEAADIGAICGGEITVSFRYIADGESGVTEEIEKEITKDITLSGFVYIFGGGHIAQELVPLLTHLDFRCIVFDDREEFSRPALFPGAEKAILGDFENIGKSITFGERDYAVIVTRGHQWDLEAWAFALNSSAAYIGVIGSKTKHELVKTRLLERGFTQDSINAMRVHAPIGIDINSDTPAEIAVSIAGELILCRARRKR